MVTAIPTAETMLAAARLPDDLAVGTLPGLTAALSALGQENGLSADGQTRALAQFEDNLARLAAIAADRKAHPEIAEVVIDRPVFILGLPRCGTSILHALIGADPQVRTPLQWEVAAPSPPPEADSFDSDPRADGFDAYVAENFTGAWADVLKAHPIGARIPQECGMILETAFQGINPTMLFRLPGYYSWYRDADTSFGYQAIVGQFIFVLAVLVRRVGIPPALHGTIGLGGKIHMSMGIDAAHGRQRIGDDILEPQIMHLHLRICLAPCHRGHLTIMPQMEQFLPQRSAINLSETHAADDLDQARDRSHHRNRITVRLHQHGIGIDRHEFRQVKGMFLHLQNPALARIFP